MSEFNQRCKACGAQLQKNLKVCPYCNATIENENADFASPEKKPKKKRSFLTTVIIIAIATVIGEYAGKYMAEDMMKSNDKNKVEKEIEKFIEQTEAYVPGDFKRDSYSSEFWGIEVDMDDWEPYSEREIEETNKQVRASSLDGAMREMEGQDIDEELVEKWKESMYVETEMAYYYEEDDMPVAEVSLGVFSAYGINETGEDELIDGMAEGIASNADNVKKDKVKIAGETYNVLSADVKDGLDKIQTKFYIREKDGMVFMLCCRTLEDYEYVQELFLDSIEKY